MRSTLLAFLLPAAALLAQEPAPQSPPATDKRAENPAVPEKAAAEKPAPTKFTLDKSAADKLAPEPDAPLPAKELSGSVSGNPDSVRPPVRNNPSPSPHAAPTYPKQYLYLVAEAMKSFKARDFRAALAYADKADGLIPATIWTINVRGAVAIEQLNFVEGKKLCIEALQIDPEFMPAKFNLCEIPFLQGNYVAARMGWQILYKNTGKDDPTTELLVYRIFLTYLLEKDMHQAKEWLDKIPFPSQTPAYQYAYAAWEHEAGQLDKWQGWIESAEFIWPQVKRADFMDVLIQLKWLPANK